MNNVVHEKFMTEALREAEAAKKDNDIPVGAVIVLNNDIIGRGRNIRNSLKDPIGHAEIIAIQDAAKHMGDWRLEGTTIYVTLEPCLMCLGAIINSRIDHLVYGATDERFGAITLYNLDINNKTNHPFITTKGILADTCRSILQDFFKTIRK